MTARQVPDTPARRSLVAIFMGVSGVGKTTVGQVAAEHFGWSLFDGDHFHSPSNIDKMRRGIALNDDDRAEWLEALRARIRQCLDEKKPAIITCSALKRKYRDVLRSNNEETIFVYLRAERDIVAERISARHGHYFGKNLLGSQYAALEEPGHAFTINAAESLDRVTASAIAILENALQNAR